MINSSGNQISIEFNNSVHFKKTQTLNQTKHPKRQFLRTIKTKHWKNHKENESE